MKRIILAALAVLAGMQALPAAAQNYYAREFLGSKGAAPATDPYAEPDYGDLSDYLTPLNNAAAGYMAFASQYGDVPGGLNTVQNSGLMPGPTWSSKIQVYPHFYDIGGSRVFTSQDGIAQSACEQINALYGASATQTVPTTPRGCVYSGGRYLVYARLEVLDTRSNPALAAAGQAMLAYAQGLGSRARSLCGASNTTCVGNPAATGYSAAPPSNVPNGVYLRDYFIGIGSSDGRYNGPAVSWDGVSDALCATLNGGGAIPVWPDRDSGCFKWYGRNQVYAYAHNPR